MKVAVVGHVEWVEFLTVDHVPAAGEIVHAGASRAQPGGGGAGAAVQLRKLASEATFFTALGDDALGRRALAGLESLGLGVHAAIRTEPTRRAITHVDSDGERTITVIGSRLGPSGVDPLPWDELADVDAVYFTAGDEQALRAARQARVLVATARTLPLLKRAAVPLDALVGSANDPSEEFSADDVLPEPRLCVWTDGGRGGTYKEGAVTDRYPAAAPPGPIVDRYGAGDSFAAGLTFALGERRATRDALALAARCGAAVLTGAGPYEGQLSGDLT